MSEMQPYCAHCKTNDHWGNECPTKKPVKLDTLVSEKDAERQSRVVLKQAVFKHCPTCTCTVTKPAKFDKGVVTKPVGRPRLHESNAEKQKSYRERQKK
jgi:hypothetical protein